MSRCAWSICNVDGINYYEVVWERRKRMSRVLERFLNYVTIDTQSSEEREAFPSTEKQKDLARLLFDEMKNLGVKDVFFDETYGYVYAKLPANGVGQGEQTIGFLAHMDTSPETSGRNVKPRIVRDYDGNDIVLNEEEQIVLSVERFPELKNYVGQQLIVTDGSTLLGADDKAGIAEIMTLIEHLMEHPSIEHGPIAICFTPDEEVGAGVDHIDLERFGADVAYTVDGGALGELEYENFNAASAKVKVHGITVHPGEAKNKMKNAAIIAMEFQGMLPQEQVPAHTEDYEGFFHLTDMQGEVEYAELNYIIRDHNRKEFEKRKHMIEQIALFLNEKYGEKTVEIEVKDSYYNMKEKIDPDYFYLIENARKCMEDLGIVPKIQPIRGGTDGARLSFMGLPCPNLCAGGHNFHGKYEYCVVESMEKIVELLLGLVMRKKVQH